MINSPTGQQPRPADAEGDAYAVTLELSAALLHAPGDTAVVRKKDLERAIELLRPADAEGPKCECGGDGFYEFDGKVVDCSKCRPITPPAQQQAQSDPRAFVLVPNELTELVSYHERCAAGCLQQDDFNGERYHNVRLELLRRLADQGATATTATTATGSAKNGR